MGRSAVRRKDLRAAGALFSPRAVPATQDSAAPSLREAPDRPVHRLSGKSLFLKSLIVFFPITRNSLLYVASLESKWPGIG